MAAPLLLDKPVGNQARSIKRSQARINLWTGSVRAGKTVGSILRWLEFTARGPAGPLLMIGKTERTLARNVLDPIETYIGSDAFDFTRGTGTVKIFGRKCYIASANDARSEDKIRGATLVGAYGDEITTWPQGFYKMLMSRLSLPGAKFFGTTNPDNPNHWLKKEWIDRRDTLDLRVFHFTLLDNPHIPDEYKAAITAEYVGLWYDRYILGRWVAAEGAIYGQHWDERMVVDDLPEMLDVWVSIDYGTANSKFVALLFGLGVDDRVYVCSEWVWDPVKERRQRTDAEYSHEVRAWLERLGGVDRWGNALPLRPRWWFVDPSAASFKTQLWQDHVPGVRDADNDVEDGIRFMAALMSNDRLRVHSSCETLIDEIPGYVWDQKKADKGQDQPLKQNDDAVDSARYGAYTQRGRLSHLLAA